ncbi:MAG: class I SAM-dependent methyltransferase [Mesorhizobium sp.]|nr:MAG: class I SAM-dependent methyltransferase [Mesorhizobium sp.]
MEVISYLRATQERTQSCGEAAIAALQLVRLYDAAAARPNGTFLELGTDRGQATKMILAACEKNGGNLVSVDIRDCSSAAVSCRWTFVQADSIDRKTILNKAPILQDGIDLVYVDSLHTPEHVLNEVYTWFSLVRKGGTICFDDIDPNPYMRGRRKDNPQIEIANRRIFYVVQSIFYDNLDQLQMTVDFGSTGLAMLRKTSEIGSELKPFNHLPAERNSTFLAKLSVRFGERYYAHKGDGSDFLTA